MYETIKWFRRSCEILEILKNLRNDTYISPEKRDTLEEILKDALALKFVAEFEKAMLFIILPEKVKSKTYREFKKKVVGENKLESWKNLFNDEIWRNVEREAIEKIKERYGYSSFNPKEDADINPIIKYRNQIAHETEGNTTVLDINSVERCIRYFDIFLTFLQKEIKERN